MDDYAKEYSMTQFIHYPKGIAVFLPKYYKKYVLSFFDRFSEVFVNYVSFQKEGFF